MQLNLNIQIPPVTSLITYNSTIALFGSCFTENIWNYFNKACFTAQYNSHGILFNPMSVCKAINDCVEKKEYVYEDLFYQNEIYNSWYHHSDFSDIDASIALQKINSSISFFHEYLKKTDCIIITLGSAFAYELIEKKIWVSNNHRAPMQWFTKKLLPTATIINELSQTIQQLKKHSISNNLQVIFTISPVRHIRDGVIDNNRSKSRLIEAIHTVCEIDNSIYYFPSYEIVIDVLRDYRFYDIDMVHPNFAATQYVWEKFVENCITSEAKSFMPEFESLSKALAHKPFHPKTKAHQCFLDIHLTKAQELTTQFPNLNLDAFIDYFSKKA